MAGFWTCQRSSATLGWVGCCGIIAGQGMIGIASGWDCSIRSEIEVRRTGREKMKRRRSSSCKKSRCEEPAEIMGLCHEHYAEHVEAQMCCDEAIRVLHHGILDGQTIQKTELAEEFRKLQEWWRRACDSINFQRKDPILRDEAKYASEWCISLAQVIIKEERLFRNGNVRPPPWNFIRDSVWDRFKNLEEGLMSNGVARPKDR